MSAPTTVRTYLSGSNLVFTDTSDQEATIGFSDENVTCAQTTNVPSGLQATQLVRIRNDGEYKILSDFEIAQTESVQLNDATGEDFTTTLTAPALSADTSLSLPAFAPFVTSFVQLDQNVTTNIKWSTPEATPVSEELAWEFGNVKQLWALPFGDPFNDLTTAGALVIPPKIPIDRASGRPSTGPHTTAANGLPFYFVQSASLFHFVVLRQLTDYQGIISWDQSTSPTQWDFRASLRVDHSGASGGQSFTMFGNGTAQNVTLNGGVLAGALANQSGGVAVEFDTSVSPCVIRVYEDATLTGTYQVGMRLGFDPGYYRIFKLQRKDSVLRVEIFSNGDTRFESHHVALEHTLDTSFTPAGTRWGIMGSSLGGSANLGLRTSYFEVRTYE